METKSNVGIHNRFDIEVIDSKTGEIKQRARGYNTVCNNLFSRLAGGSYDYAKYIQYGSGTGTPSSNDTQLFSLVGAIAPNRADDVHTDRSYEGISVATRKIVLSESTSVGITLTEVGLAYSNSNGSLTTHAMLKDMNGNQITILKTNTDIINIYATIFLHWDETGDFHLFLGSGSSTGFNGSRYASSPLTDRFMGIPEGEPDGSYGGGEMGHLWGLNLRLNSTTYRQYAPYIFYQRDKSVSHDATNRRITITLKRFGAGEVNDVGGIGRFVYVWANSTYAYASSSYFCDGGAGRGIWLVIDAGGTAIPPTQISSEAVGTGNGSDTDFAVKFNFPYDATVYVNGVEQTSGVSVVRGPIITSNLVNFMDARYRNYPKIPAQTNIGDNNNTWYASYSYYNFAYDVGIASVNASSGILYGSNDGEAWTEIHSWSSSETYALTGTEQHYKYFKTTTQMSYTWNAWNGKAIKFNTAPSNGDAITVSYKTPFVPKDSEHVFDLTHTFTFGEYQEG